MLRGDPNFRRLPPAEQQRVVRQLHQVNQLSDEQRQRRLARAEMIEHLPVERQMMMKRAFQDLRAVPLEQRPTVLNSERYQDVFTPEERGILADMLLVEPYQPMRP
jgi:phage-related protein